MRSSLRMRLSRRRHIALHRRSPSMSVDQLESGHKGGSDVAGLGVADRHGKGSPQNRVVVRGVGCRL